MPPQETAFLNDTVLYWEASTAPDRHGTKGRRVYAPIEVTPPHGVRIDDKKTLMRDAQGNNVKCDAVMTAGREFVPQSIVLKMTESYYLGTGSDSAPLEFFEVVAEDETFDLKGRASVHVVGLNRYRGNLPEVIP